MNQQAGFLSSIFNWKAIAWGVGSFFVLGVTDYLFFHDHPLGQAIIEMVKTPVLNFFDGVANVLGLTEYVRNPQFLTAAGQACLAGVDLETGVPIACGPV